MQTAEVPALAGGDEKHKETSCLVAIPSTWQRSKLGGRAECKGWWSRYPGSPVFLGCLRHGALLPKESALRVETLLGFTGSPPCSTASTTGGLCFFGYDEIQANPWNPPSHKGDCGLRLLDSQGHLVPGVTHCAGPAPVLRIPALRTHLLHYPSKS